MRVLVTGAAGFVARHLLPCLASRGAEVSGTVLRAGEPSPRGVPVETLDITDASACARILRAVHPTHVVHLAAASSVPWSFAHPAETHRINVAGTRNILEAAVALSPPPVVLIVGSAEEYGPNDGRPLPELPLADLHPTSPYAESKVAVERLIEGDDRFRACAVRTRSFPHVGPGQKFGFFTADVASQLVRISRGGVQPVLRVGNVESVRDYTDVRDVVRAYVLLLERGVPGEVYNVASGRGVALREVLDALVRLAGVAVTVARDPSRLRPAEVPVLIGDGAKLRAATGWAPEIPLRHTLGDILTWWEREVTSDRGTPERALS